jgi:hypothetical protein
LHDKNTDERKKKMKNDDQKEARPSEPCITTDVNDEMVWFCEDARESLERIMDLFDALDDQCDRLDEPQSEPETEAEADKTLERETRIARTLLGLLAEKSKKLSRRASDSKANLETVLNANLK